MFIPAQDRYTSLLTSIEDSVDHAPYSSQMDIQINTIEYRPCARTSGAVVPTASNITISLGSESIGPKVIGICSATVLCQCGDEKRHAHR